MLLTAHIVPLKNQLIIFELNGHEYFFDTSHVGARSSHWIFPEVCCSPRPEINTVSPIMFRAPIKSAL